MTEKYEESRVFKMACDYLDSGVSEWTDALREFFQHERDKELGRWRWPEDPDFVVYPIGENQQVRVVNERTGYFNTTPRPRGFAKPVEEMSTQWRIAARAYFSAHPEPKPWHYAREGEAWAITVNGKEYPAIFQAGRFRDHGGSWNAEDISNARKIWPES